MGGPESAVDLSCRTVETQQCGSAGPGRDGFADDRKSPNETRDSPMLLSWLLLKGWSILKPPSVKRSPNWAAPALSNPPNPVFSQTTTASG